MFSTSFRVEVCATARLPKSTSRDSVGIMSGDHKPRKPETANRKYFRQFSRWNFPVIDLFIFRFPFFDRVYNLLKEGSLIARVRQQALMNVHLSYRLPKLPAVEKDVQHQIDKLRKRLQVFRPELVHLRGVVEEASAREGTSVSLNLRLPSGQMAVETKAANANAAVKAAFEDLLQQLNRHKEMLRASHRWRRRRGDTTRRGAPLREVPFEQTLAAVFPPTISADDIRSYVNANLSRLERFVEREIYFREAQETTPPNSI